eukprot:TRINITY_DN3947_c0_g2_i2.p1 TRINITY_DN3947_c0_g2~~TRINITY_DN3947_c0_g2_i2.p1  ORF type:complete len:266 (+),score=39.06 TRINITY_DN3947_c0_g2_i2:116-913(+)
MGRTRWGDVNDDEEVLPESTTVGPNDRGIITKTEYYRNNKGDAIKKTTKIQVVKAQTKVYEVAQQRRQWPKFGQAAVTNEGVTMQSVDDIMFERTNLPKKDEKKEERVQAPAGTRSLAEIMAEKRRHREMLRAQGLLSQPGAPPLDDEPNSAAEPKKGVYVPPSRKPGAVPQERRDFDNSLRVSNLSDNVTDYDLKELFGKFGEIARVYVAYDRETHEHRGFAFVNFRSRMDAERAMHALDGYGYDNMILRVEMAAPREPRPQKL